MGSKKNVGSKKMEGEKVGKKNFIFWHQVDPSEEDLVFFFYLSTWSVNSFVSRISHVFLSKPYADIRACYLISTSFYSVYVRSLYQTQRLQRLDSKGVITEHKEGLRKEKVDEEKGKLEYRGGIFPR